MFEPLETLVSNDFRMFGPFNVEEIEKVEYYLTPPSNGDAYLDPTVKLGTKCTLKNGKQYGNIISIPWETLKGLVKQHE